MSSVCVCECVGGSLFALFSNQTQTLLNLALNLTLISQRRRWPWWGAILSEFGFIQSKPYSALLSREENSDIGTGQRKDEPCNGPVAVSERCRRDRADQTD